MDSREHLAAEETVGREPDPERLKEFSKRLFDLLQGAVTSALVCLGDELGLYRALAEAGPSTSAELAAHTGLSERWLREWLYNQGAAGLLEQGPRERFALSPEAEVVLAREEHPAFGAGMFTQLPALVGLLERLPESFRSGIGLPYDALGPDGAQGIERGFAPWTRRFLVPLVIGQVEELRPALEQGRKVADVGCGSGLALLELARAFPRCQCHGYEISRHALERAEEHRSQAGLENVHFHDAREEPLANSGDFGLVLTLDCLHDMTRPDQVMREIRAALAPDGVWIIADIKALPTFEENVAKNPMAAMMYGFSVLTCMSSALSEPGGLGLGTLGLYEARARELAEAAGFTRFRRMAVDHPVNAFYEVRP